MADNAAYISDMNTSLPTNRDPRADGAAEIRAVKTAVKNCFPNLNGVVTADASRMNEIFNAGFHIGMIMPWYGVVENIPEGWALCNGQITNNYETPNLMGMGLFGAEAEDDIAGTEVGITNPKLTDVIEVVPTELKPENIPAHRHKFQQVGADGVVQAEGNYVGRENVDHGGNDFPFQHVVDTPTTGHGTTLGMETVGGSKQEDGTYQTVAHKHDLAIKTTEDGREEVLFDNRPKSALVFWIIFVGSPKF